MSIGSWFKRLFSPSPARSDASAEVAAQTHEEKTIDDARIDAGGSGALGLSNDPSAHASPGEVVADSEAGAE